MLFKRNHKRLVKVSKLKKKIQKYRLKSKPLTLEKLIIDDVAIEKCSLMNITFKDCRFFNVSFSSSYIENTKFINCSFDKIKLKDICLLDELIIEDSKASLIIIDCATVNTENIKLKNSIYKGEIYD